MPDGLRVSARPSAVPASAVKTPPAKAGVHLTEQRFGALNLRGNPADAAFLGGIERQLGFALPLKPNTTAEHGSKATVWLGPDEWLVLTPLGEEVGVAAGLRQALAGVFFTVTDITHGQVVLRLSGRSVRDVLSKGCSLDLHPKGFGPGRCAQTLLAKVGVTLRWVDDEPTFDLIVRRSFAEYLMLWLRDAAEEYGVTTEAVGSMASP
jgi:sarcosine oxidase subunit gamma